MINTSFAELNGINFEYFQNDVIGESSIAIGKEWESHITSFVNIYNSLYPIKNIIDVGSYFGYHTIFFSKNVQEKVYSFEPQSQNFQLLQNNIKRNNIDNVIIYNSACGDIRCDISMCIIENNTNIVDMGDFLPIITEISIDNPNNTKEVNENSNIINIDSSNDTIELTNKIELIKKKFFNNIKYSNVEVVLLDDIITSQQIDIIKIDTRGWETKVILGSYKTIETYKPIIIINIDREKMIRTFSSCIDVFNTIKGLNYTIFYLDYSLSLDHICVHNDNMEKFKTDFQNYIFPNTENNNSNNNLIHGIKEKIVLNVDV